MLESSAFAIGIVLVWKCSMARLDPRNNMAPTGKRIQSRPSQNKGSSEGK